MSYYEEIYMLNNKPLFRTDLIKLKDEQINRLEEIFIDYIRYRGEEEVIVLPEDITDVKLYTIKSL